MRRLFCVALVLVLATLVPGAAQEPVPAPAAQSPATLTAEDLLKVTTVSVLDLSDDGRFVAAIMRRTFDNASTDHLRYGDPTYVAPVAVRLQVFDTQSGATQSPLDGLVDVRQAAWSPDSRLLALLVYGTQAKGGEPGAALHIWDVTRAALRRVPVSGDAGITVNSGLAWSPDSRSVLVSVRPRAREAEARARFLALTEGPIIVHRAKDPFLEWDELGRTSRQRALAVVDIATGVARTVLPERRVSSYQMTRDGSFITFQDDLTEKTDYDTIGGTDNSLLVVPAAGGEPRTIVEAKDLKGLTLRWSDDGRTFAYAKKGEVFVQNVDDAKPRSLTPAPESKAGEKPAEKPADKPTPPAGAAGAKEEEKENFSVGPFSRDAARLLITSKKGWYVVTVATAAREQVLTLDADEEKNPRTTAIGWDPAGGAIYLTWSDRTRWERGLARLDVATKTITPLVKDARVYTGFRQSRNGQRWVVSVSDGDRPAELFSGDAGLASMKKLTDLNPWLAQKSVPRSELVSYRDTDGKVLYGVLRYPVGYEKGRTYPTVFEIYETFFDNGFNGRAAFLANHGYAVFHPSVNLVVGRPGEAWVKGVTSAANRLIDMGIADPARLGVHGTSYGGYATALLLTQTDRFKAAINVSGKVNMISFYTDSPRLGVRNTHAPEKSQDRIGGTLWEYPERYLEHSAVLRADRITTPLLCITGDLDPNVPASQSREIYYALRRLGKDVEWVRYVNGAHRPPNSVAEAVDFEHRILAWYDKYLKAAETAKK
jgi:dipeptidyl aminopeptidase/acylaminoacyl peptidase